MNPRAEHLLYTLFKRNVGTTVTVAVILTIVLYFIAPAVGIVAGVATALLVAWWIVFLVNG